MALVPRVIPCLLLEERALVKTTRFADPVYVGDPVNILSIFNDFEVDEIMLLDIGGARSRRPAPGELLRQCAEECFIPLSYGGGLDAVDEIGEILSIGFEKVVLNTVASEAPDVVRRAVEDFGRQAIVGAIDVRHRAGSYDVVVRGGHRSLDRRPVEWAQELEQLGVGEILVTAVDREGTRQGFDLDLVASVADAVGVPVIAHGGAGKRRDLAAPVREAHAAAVAAGSLFVFQRSRESVLVNYPSRAQLEALIPEART